MTVQGNKKILQEKAIVLSLPRKGKRSTIYWTGSSEIKKGNKGLSKRRDCTKVI